MAININSPYIPSYNNGVYQTTTTQATYQPQQRYISTFFINSEQEAASMPNPVTGCSFYVVDGDTPVLIAKYADGRPMEVYDMQLRAPQPQTQYLTEEKLYSILDERMEKLTQMFDKKFVIRNDRKERNNG